MKKLLSPTDWLLLGLSNAFDFIQETRDGMKLYHQYYQTFYGYTPKNHKTNSYHLLWRNLKTGNIDKKIENGEIVLELTSVGKKRIQRDFPLLGWQNKSWDKTWRIAIFDIEEKNKWVRDSFRQKLKELGFGCLQKSVWISPYDFLQDFKEFLEEHSLEDNVVLLETSNFYYGDIKQLADKLWHLEEINSYYRTLEEKLKQVKSLTNNSDRVNMLKILREKVIRVYLKDPHLPKEFLPDDWQGNEVRNLVKTVGVF